MVALLNLSSWYLVMVEPLFLAVLRGCLRFVIVVFPDHAHLLFFKFCRCINHMMRRALNNVSCDLESMVKVK